MSIEKEVLEKLRALPGDKQREVLHFVASLARDSVSTPDGGVGDDANAPSAWTGEAEMRWLREHGGEYAGRWVALDGDRLVAHGAEGREVYRDARARGVENPFVTFVESDVPFVAGW
jgi:hypothetical protein